MPIQRSASIIEEPSVSSPLASTAASVTTAQLPGTSPGLASSKGSVGAPPIKSVEPCLHLRQEFTGGVDDADLVMPPAQDQSSCDYYSVHGLLTQSPRSRETFFVKKDANAAQGLDDSSRSNTADQKQPTEVVARRPSESADRLYPLRFPQSLYGPLGETLPRLTPQHLNHPTVAVLHNANHHASAVPTPGSSLTSNPSKRGTTTTIGLLADTTTTEDRTLLQLAEASLTAASNRNFAGEWAKALGMNPINSLSALSCRQEKLRSIAVDFSETVAPIACSIIETRNNSPSQRPYRPLPTMDHVYIVKGHVFVVSESSARIKAYGSHEAAGRAASNEIRASRTILGNPLLGVHVPLSCCVSFMGYHVFVTAPIAIPRSPEACLMYGGFRPSRVVVGTGAIYLAYKMGEYIPLLRHAVPEAALAKSSGTSSLVEAKRTVTTACDVKLVYEATAGSVYALDTARYMPPAACHTPEFSKTKTKEDGLGTRGLSRHPLEDDCTSHLTVLFRPEFMRHTCPILLNGDANTPHQPQNSQEAISHAIHTLFTQNCWHLVGELIAAEQAKTLCLSDLSTLFHKHGVNVRYMGKIYADLDVGSKSFADTREAVKHKLAVEAACRAFKSIVNHRISLEHKFRGEESLLVAMLRNFLMCNEHSSTSFWEETLRPVMHKKFGFYSRVSRQGNAQSAGDEDAAAVLNDGSTVNIYHCLSNVKRRIERVTPSLNWKCIGGGFVTLDEEGIERLRRQSEDALSVLYPLLGRNARENSDLLIRSQQLIGVDITSDLRGKKIIVNFKPKIKACTPLALSQGMQAVVDNGPKDIQEVLGMGGESRPLCEAVEAACKAELAAIAKISETDPRSTVPLQLLSLSFSGRMMYPQAYAAASRWFDLRKNIPIDVVVGGAALEVAPVFLKAQSLDRAETFCVEGLISLRNATTGVDVASFTQALIATAKVAATSLTDTNGKPQLDRVQRVLEYLRYACFLSERYHLPYTVHAMWLMASIRKKLATSFTCFRCNRQAELAVKGDFDAAQLEKVGTEKDANSVASKPATTTTATGAALAVQSRLRAGVPAHRRKREEARNKDDEDVAEVFAKKSIERIQTLFLDEVLGGGAPQRITPALAASSSSASLTRSASAANIAALAQAVTASLGSDQEVPQCQSLQDLPLSSIICKPSRYTCKACSNKHPAPEKEPIMKDAATMFAKLSAVAVAQRQAHATFDKNVVGDALLNLGTLEGNAASVSMAVEELSVTFGADSRVAIAAAIQLADVLLDSAKAMAPANSSGAVGSHTTVVLPSSTATAAAASSPPSPSLLITQQQATVGVADAERVLHEALGKILGRADATTSFAAELNTVVYKLQDIAHIYALHPVAKKEHAAAHYLSDVLPPALGLAHPLVGAAYNATKHYYVQLSKKRADRTAASTALQTAGKYACLAIKSRVVSPDNEDELDSLLTVMAEDILKVLRASGTPSDRKASEELFSVCKQTISDSPYQTSVTLQQRLAVMEEIFKAQLKVMEQSEALSRLSQRVDDAKVRMAQLFASIKRHKNRVDLYGHQCLQGMTDIRNETRRACKGVTEAAVLHKLAALDELYVALTKSSPDASGTSGVGADGGSDSHWSSMLGGVARQPTGVEKKAGATDESEAPAGAAATVAHVNPKLARAYVSPYATLGGAPVVMEDDNDDIPTSHSTTKSADRSKHLRNHGHHRDHQKPLALTDAAQYFLSTLSDRPGTSNPCRSAKQPETVEQLAVMIPRIAQASVTRNHNPIRAYSQQVLNASSKSK